MGPFQTVKDISVSDLRSNTAMLAKLATLLKIPVIYTASTACRATWFGPPEARAPATSGISPQ